MNCGYAIPQEQEFYRNNITQNILFFFLGTKKTSLQLVDSFFSSCQCRFITFERKRIFFSKKSKIKKIAKLFFVLQFLFLVEKSILSPDPFAKQVVNWPKYTFSKDFFQSLFPFSMFCFRSLLCFCQFSYKKKLLDEFSFENSFVNECLKYPFTSLRILFFRFCLHVFNITTYILFIYVLNLQRTW